MADKARGKERMQLLVEQRADEAMDSRLNEFAAGRATYDGVHPHPWVSTGKNRGDEPSLACLHCPHGKNHIVHSVGDNVVSLSARRRG